MSRNKRGHSPEEKSGCKNIATPGGAPKTNKVIPKLLRKHQDTQTSTLGLRRKGPIARIQKTES